MKDHTHTFQHLYTGKVHDKPILPILRVTRIKMLTTGKKCWQWEIAEQFLYNSTQSFNLSMHVTKCQRPPRKAKKERKQQIACMSLRLHDSGKLKSTISWFLDIINFRFIGRYNQLTEPAGCSLFPSYRAWWTLLLVYGFSLWYRFDS